MTCVCVCCANGRLTESLKEMQQLVALLSAGPTEPRDQLRRVCDDTLQDKCDDLLTCTSPPINSHRTVSSSTASSSFSIDHILSSSPQRRNHGDHQHQQPDKYHHDVGHQSADESLTTYHNSTSLSAQSLGLPVLPLSQALYGRSL